MSSSQIHVIGDSSALIAFAAVGRLDLLAKAFACVWVPPAVEQEVLAADLPPNRLLRAALREGVFVLPVELTEEAKRLAFRYEEAVDRGEAEAIAVARCMGRPVLLDDLAARRLAQNEGVTYLGSLGVLSLCKKARVIEAVRPIADAMRRQGRFFSPVLLERFYQSMGE